MIWIIFFNEWEVFVDHLLGTGSGTRVQKWTEKNLCPPGADILVEKDNWWHSEWLLECVWHGHLECGPQVTASPPCVTRCPQPTDKELTPSSGSTKAPSTQLSPADFFCFLARLSRWRTQRAEQHKLLCSWWTCNSSWTGCSGQPWAGSY